jgi:hypothetical protein
MGVIEADQPRAIRSMQRERVRQSVRALLDVVGALDLELDPIAFFEMMDASIEGQQELKPIIGLFVYHVLI